MNNRTFEILKWIAIVVIPAFATFVGLVGKGVNWQHTDVTVMIITGFGVFLGSILGVSNRTYKKFSSNE
ncbi:phage holin [Enterococcus lactis]|uniref:phage holin n=1 Tax=Enterococcus lactis TaxID=357441 RepID=UPI004042748B